MSSYTDRYALIDCNNFFVSCERVFNPQLRNKPVAVLSNNDGCIISRSEELKKLGVPMCAVVFEWKDILEKHNVILCSGNFSLYQDMSDRVFQILRKFSEAIEIYSVDEAFLRLTLTDERKLIDYCRRIKQTVYEYTGIPVSIGIGTNKTQAKLANKIAKSSTHNGVALLDTNSMLTYAPLLKLDDIWGIGYRSIKKLPVFNINSIQDFMKTDRHLLKQKFGVLMERTWLELHGVRCYPINTNRSSKKGILCSRTFKYAHSDYKKTLEAVASYAATAAVSLRNQNSLAGSISVFISTGKHSASRLINSHEIILDTPSAYTPTLAKAALTSLAKIYKSGIKYKRAGVFLSNLYDIGEVQQNMFAAYTSQIKNSQIMATVDYLNSEWGKGTIKFANQGINVPVVVEQVMKSPKYTTNWLELPIISSRRPKFISRYQT